MAQALEVIRVAVPAGAMARQDMCWQTLQRSLRTQVSIGCYSDALEVCTSLCELFVPAGSMMCGRSQHLT